MRFSPQDPRSDTDGLYNLALPHKANNQRRQIWTFSVCLVGLKNASIPIGIMLNELMTHVPAMRMCMWTLRQTIENGLPCAAELRRSFQPYKVDAKRAASIAHTLTFQDPRLLDASLPLQQPWLRTKVCSASARRRLQLQSRIARSENLCLYLRQMMMAD